MDIYKAINNYIDTTDEGADILGALLILVISFPLWIIGKIAQILRGK